MVTTGKDGYTEFRFFRPNAANVFLAGDFNEWRPDQLRMARQDDGYWALKLRLSVGDYKFRYVADGQWYTDFAAFGVEPGRFGMDSVVRVAEPTLKFPMTPAEIAAAA